MSRKLIFSIDGKPFSDYGLHVESCSGLLHIPKRKERLSNSDSQTHGKFYDIGAIAKYEERVITLNCFIAATSRLDFFTKVNAITGLFDGTGYHRLLAELGADIKLPFEVIRADGDKIEPTWNTSKTVGYFRLQLIEPIPVKRVVVANGGVVEMAMVTEKLVSIGWGNGTYDYDLSGTIEMSKTLPTGTQIVIMGDIEEITNFNLSGGTVKWDIWC